MKASELRIGNWYKYSEHEFLKPELKNKPSKIIADDLVFLCEDEYNSKFIEPIVLTDKFILKAGFEKIAGNYFKYILNDWTFLYFDNGYFELSINRHSCTIKIQYLHQLQNLYFALTGEELKIEL